MGLAARTLENPSARRREALPIPLGGVVLDVAFGGTGTPAFARFWKGSNTALAKIGWATSAKPDAADLHSQVESRTTTSNRNLKQGGTK
jgi:hypothetical protein